VGAWGYEGTGSDLMVSARPTYKQPIVLQCYEVLAARDKDNIVASSCKMRTEVSSNSTSADDGYAHCGLQLSFFEYMIKTLIGFDAGFLDQVSPARHVRADKC
jgi:hypothetical protein